MISPLSEPTPSSTRASTEDKYIRASLPRWSLWVAGYVIFLCSLYLLWTYNFLEHYDTLVDIWQIAGESRLAFTLWLIVQGLMFGSWVVAILCLRGRSLRDVWLPVIGITGLIYAAFLFVYPATAIDVYIYAARSHLLTDYGFNPSTFAPVELWDTDPFVHYASGEWGSRVSPYGPLWNLIAAPATAFDGESIRTSILLLKSITILSALGIGYLLYATVRIHRPELALSAAIGWLWCPVVLWEGIANSHNDVILMLPLIAALWCWYRGYLGWVVPLIVLSALIKIVTLMVLPVAAVTILAQVGFNRRLIGIATQSAILSVGAAWIAFAPFYDIRGAIDAVQSQRGVWVSSPALILSSFSDTRGWGLDVRSWYEDFTTVFIVTLTLVGSLVGWKRPHLLPRIAFEQFFWFLLLATSNLRPWYAIWLIAIAAMLPLGFTWLRAGAWALGGLYSYGFSAWIRNWYEWEFVNREAINLAIMIGPVIIVTVWWAWDTMRNQRRQDASSRGHSSPETSSW